MAETRAKNGTIKVTGRPRSEVARQSVLDAAYVVLAEKGVAGFSIEAVATHSGVARTTIYRSWPTKGLLAVATLLEAFGRELVYVETADAVADFRILLQSLVQLLSGPTGQIAASVMAEAQSDEQTRQAFLEQFSMPLRQRSGRILARGIANGVLRSDLDVPVVLDAAVGSAYLRLLMGQPLELSWAISLADTLLKGCSVKADGRLAG